MIVIMLVQEDILANNVQLRLGKHIAVLSRNSTGKDLLVCLLRAISRAERSESAQQDSSQVSTEIARTVLSVRNAKTARQNLRPIAARAESVKYNIRYLRLLK